MLPSLTNDYNKRTDANVGSLTSEDSAIEARAPVAFESSLGLRRNTKSVEQKHRQNKFEQIHRQHKLKQLKKHIGNTNQTTIS